MNDKIVSTIIRIALRSPGTVTHLLESIKDTVVEYHIKQTRKKLVALRKKYDLEQNVIYQEAAIKIMSAIQDFVAKQNLNEEQNKIFKQILLADTDWIKLDSVMSH